MFVIGPLAHVRADLGEDGLGKGIADAVHGHEVHPGDAEDMGTGVDRRGILTVRVGLAPWGRGGPRRVRALGGGLEARLDDGEGVFDLRIAGAELGGVEIEQREGLREDKQMLLRARCPSTPARSRPHPSCSGSCARRPGGCGSRSPATMARMMRCPVVACDIAERLGQLDIHLQQGLLHVEDMRGAMLKELGAMAQAACAAPRSPRQDETRPPATHSCARSGSTDSPATSLLRPGTRLMDWALIRQHWMPRASKVSNSGIQ